MTSETTPESWHSSLLTRWEVVGVELCMHQQLGRRFPGTMINIQPGYHGRSSWRSGFEPSASKKRENTTGHRSPQDEEFGMWSENKMEFYQNFGEQKRDIIFSIKIVYLL
ncbi:hypothetical protein AVEN_70358-1 [Araneus ventricosus]|uniref:Uncharacterized protein n=1 Tax=Araneus ventricosus TaxID=182803 RepID=A0A4Y2TN35_ARAVE|nr:hypothetical protein AVEN_70358-1 [Araneus ventricosus]